MKTPEEMEEARKQLDELAQKLGVKIGGCGCCGSPWLVDKNDEHYVTAIDGVQIGQ